MGSMELSTTRRGARPSGALAVGVGEAARKEWVGTPGVSAPFWASPAVRRAGSVTLQGFPVRRSRARREVSGARSARRGTGLSQMLRSHGNRPAQ